MSNEQLIPGCSVGSTIGQPDLWPTLLLFRPMLAKLVLGVFTSGIF